ncbi:MAG: hypothetical protein CMM87_00865 [Rickettsiales bacterium]|nr:hypothetical protein [Rickettsiales bacterium]|tara:strand:+ start:9631 stop:10659 length:1029 start_codon:yes stop_codon:yes gene_type:complete
MIVPSYKLAGSSVDQLKKAQGYLLYADDFGLIEFYQRVLLTKIDLDAVRLLRQENVLSGGASLIGEVRQTSMFSAPSNLIIQGCTDKIVPQIEEFLTHTDGAAKNTKIVCQAGYLKPASKLRKLFDQNAELVSCGCYAPSESELASVLRALLKNTYDLDIEPRALSLLAYGLTDQLYNFTSVAEILRGINKTGCVTETEVRAAVTPSKQGQFDVFLNAFLARDQATCLRELKRLFRDGHSVISQLRLLGVFMQRWLGLIAGVANGLSVQDANRQDVMPPFAPFQLKKITSFTNKWTIKHCFEVIEWVHHLEQVVKRNSTLEADILMLQGMSLLIDNDPGRQS